MNIDQLEFPFRIREINNQLLIYDEVRKKYIKLTPEELVRQHVIYHLLHNLNLPKHRIAVEKSLSNSKRRFDILIFSKQLAPIAIIECKAKSERLQQSTFTQISNYNLDLKVPYLIITNWERWLAAEIDITTQSFKILNQFPDLLSI